MDCCLENHNLNIVELSAKIKLLLKRKKISLSDFAKNTLNISRTSLLLLLEKKSYAELNENELRHFNTIEAWIDILDNKMPNSESVFYKDPMVPVKETNNEPCAQSTSKEHGISINVTQKRKYAKKKQSIATSETKIQFKRKYVKKKRNVETTQQRPLNENEIHTNPALIATVKRKYVKKNQSIATLESHVQSKIQFKRKYVKNKRSAEITPVKRKYVKKKNISTSEITNNILQISKNTNRNVIKMSNNLKKILKIKNIKLPYFAENFLGISRKQLYFVLRPTKVILLNRTQKIILEKINNYLNANKHHIHSFNIYSKQLNNSFTKKHKSNKIVRSVTKIQKSKSVHKKTLLNSIKNKYKNIRGRQVSHISNKKTAVRKLLKYKNASIIKYIK